MILYGTTTSPYVRRVRIVAESLGVTYKLIDTATDQGQAELRRISPAWKVPVALIDNSAATLDSHTIIARLEADHGPSRFASRKGATHWTEQNLIALIDTLLDASVHLFYVKREGVDLTSIPYLVKQSARCVALVSELEKRLQNESFFDDGTFGLAEMYLATVLDWVRFRSVHALWGTVALPTAFDTFSAHWAEDVVLRSTLPG